jgi:hypothetical protein
LKHEVWEIPGHLIHSSLQSLAIFHALTSSVLAFLSLPSLTDFMSFFHGLLSMGFLIKPIVPFSGGVRQI